MTKLKRWLVIVLIAVCVLLAAAVALYFRMDYAPGRQVVWRAWFPYDARQAIIDANTKSVYLLDDEGYLTRINERGRVAWRRVLRCGGAGLLIGPDGGAIICGGAVQYYSIAGDLRWSINTKINIIDVREVDVTGKPAVVAIDDERCFFGFDADGRIAWMSDELPASDCAFELHPASDGGFYYFSDDDELIVLENNGTIRWRYQLGHNCYDNPSMWNNDFEYKGEYYVGSYEYQRCGMVTTAELARVGANGNQTWVVDEEFEDYAQPFMMDGVVITASVDGEVISYSENGDELWRRQLDGCCAFLPALNNEVFVIEHYWLDYRVLAIDPTGADPDHDCVIVRKALTVDRDSHLVLEKGRILTLARWDF